MAKKKVVPATKKETEGEGQQLVDAIVTVKHLQDFVHAHGGVEKALEAVVKVHELMQLTGGFEQLKQALEIVGKGPAPMQ
jgi:hypothetical protein